MGKGIDLTPDQELVERKLATLLGASVESIRRWKVFEPSNGTLTAEFVAEAKDAVGALRGWWPQGEMPATFKNLKPWMTKEELAEVRKVLASEIGVHINTLRFLWRNHEIPPLPPDRLPSLGYLATLENHASIRTARLEANLATIKKKLSAKVGESVPTLHHLWRHGAIPELPHDGNLTTKYVADIRSRVKGWRAEIRDQKKLTAERKTKAATRNREAAQKKKLLELLLLAGPSVSLTSVRRWLRKGQIQELPKDGSLPAEYVKAVADFAKRAPERHRENTRLGQSLPGVQERKSESQRRAARRPEVKARKSVAAKTMWAKRRAELAQLRKVRKDPGRPGGSLTEDTLARITLAAFYKLQGWKKESIARRLYPRYSRENAKNTAKNSIFRPHQARIEARAAELSVMDSAQRNAIFQEAVRLIPEARG